MSLKIFNCPTFRFCNRLSTWCLCPSRPLTSTPTEGFLSSVLFPSVSAWSLKYQVDGKCQTSSLRKRLLTPLGIIFSENWSSVTQNMFSAAAEFWVLFQIVMFVQVPRLGKWINIYFLRQPALLSLPACLSDRNGWKKNPPWTLIATWLSHSEVSVLPGVTSIWYLLIFILVPSPSKPVISRAWQSITWFLHIAAVRITYHSINYSEKELKRLPIYAEQWKPSAGLKPKARGFGILWSWWKGVLVSILYSKKSRLYCYL